MRLCTDAELLSEGPLAHSACVYVLHGSQFKSHQCGFSPLALSVGPSCCHWPCSWAGTCLHWGLGNKHRAHWELRAGPGTCRIPQVPVAHSDGSILVCRSAIAAVMWSSKTFAFWCRPLSKLEKAINTNELKTPFPEPPVASPFSGTHFSHNQGCLSAGPFMNGNEANAV